MSIKPKGKCPFCNETIIAEVIEKNTIRRDKCKCPKCDKIIYVCMGIGCDDYAKSGVVWDDNYCPKCTDEIIKDIKQMPEKIKEHNEKRKK